MKSVPCSRLWQAEAHHDGRIGPSEEGAYERHAASCADCSRELARLAALDAAVLEALPEPARGELETRRARQALLRAADAALLGRAPRHRALRYALAPGLLAAAAAIVLIVWQLAARAPEVPSAAQFEIRDVAGADWSEETLGATTRVVLRAGTAGFHVEHLDGPPRFVVALPDGELEVRGTRFVVEVKDGHTRSVVVEEGTVALEVPGFSGLLHAGEGWPNARAARAVEAAGRIASTANEASASASASASAGASAGASASASASAGASASASAGASASAAGVRFAAAMAAYSGGDYGRADALFAAFVADFPRDARAEDATFLRADARARRGDSAGAALAARAYLAAYPHGLRRPEAQRLAGPP